MDKAGEPGNDKKPADTALGAVVFVSGDPEQESPKKLSIVVNWKKLISLQVVLMLGQVIIGITILAAISTEPFWKHSSTEWKALIFVTYNATAVTVLRLIDAIVGGQPVRRLFVLPDGDRLELWFVGLVAFLLHLFSFFVTGSSLVATIGGYVAAVLYFADWCRMHRVRASGSAGAQGNPVVVGST
ncbi:uncharacterized protein LOC129761935 [Toxorhynchites rutilus septentrionalis]|uniref:uncharacterized protein LOC129761935 n=1 Tax=Toxorhynchites rutilus septentrionalis TaxID=329112 RepID=UPI00247AE98F|nr:uncharacterized protein LOC129761935 [Toxorhynchites rutilus septentrionalis]